MLKAERGYESIPPNLLDEAFQKWQRYEESYQNVDSEDSPKMFLFRNAINSLGFPSEYFNKRENKFIPYKKTTLQKHYDKGEKLVCSRNNQVLY